MDPLLFYTRKALSLSLCCLSLQLLPSTGLAEETISSPHEALLLKRIVEYWKDQDYRLAKRQIIDFLNQYANSAFKDHLMAMLGDLYFNEENYNESIKTYSQIEREEFKEKTFLKHLKALFELEQFAAVEKMAHPRLLNEKDKESEDALQIALLYADALFRQGKIQEAFPHFERLLQTTYRDYCLLPLAEGLREQKQYPQAVSYYRDLLKKRDDKREEILFQIGTLLAEYDKEEAAKTFLEVTRLKGEKEGLAAFNYLALLYDAKEYQTLANEAPSLMTKIPDKELHLIRFYLGSSNCFLKNYEQAIAALELFVQNEKEPSSQLKTALLSLILCARETADQSLSERALSLLASHFAKDPAYLQSFVINAQTQKEQGSFTLNVEEFKKLLSFFDQFEEREKLVYDVALLLVDDHKWEAARDILLIFLEEYPQSEKRVFAYRHLITTSMEALKSSPESLVHKECLVADLKKFFQEESLLTEEEEQELRFYLAKTLYDLNRPGEALQEFEAFLLRFSGSLRAAEAHLMGALCIQASSQDLVKVSFHLEQALLCNPNQEDATLIHLQLYNSYLTLSSQNEEKQDSFLEQAAEHLFSAFMRAKESVKFDNQIWLANYYYSKVKKERESVKNAFDEHFLPLKRSLATYEKILGLENGIVAFPKERDLLVIEGEALKYSDLLSLKKDLPIKISLLERLSELRKENPDLKWKYQETSLFELAKAYEIQEDTKKALELYELLLTNHSPSYLSSAALLQKTRLQFALLPSASLQENSSEVEEILNQLKDLQIKKQLACEPIHLEAALEYVKVRVALTPEESRLDKHLFYLKRFKEDFASADDSIGQEYATDREKFPEQEKLYQIYMTFVDAEIARLQAEEARRGGEEERASQLLSQAETQLEALLNDSSSLTPFLREGIEQSKAALH